MVSCMDMSGPCIPYQIRIHARYVMETSLWSIRWQGEINQQFRYMCADILRRFFGYGHMAQSSRPTITFCSHAPCSGELGSQRHNMHAAACLPDLLPQSAICLSRLRDPMSAGCSSRLRLRACDDTCHTQGSRHKFWTPHARSASTSFTTHQRQINSELEMS